MAQFDPFRIAQRRFPAAEVYWQQVDSFQVDSLCDEDVSLIPHELIEARLHKLTRAEKNDGFVFEAERLWLLDFQNSESGRQFNCYGDWLHYIFDNELLSDQLRWASLDSGSGYVCPENINVWWAAFYDQHFFEALREATRRDSLTRWIEDWPTEGPELCVYGLRKSPSHTHLRQLFESLHNFPYHASMALQIIGRKDWAYSAISVTDAENPAIWSIEYMSEYGGDNQHVFLGRRPEPVAGAALTDREIRETLISHLNPIMCPDWESLQSAQGSDFGRSKLCRYTFRYRDLLPDNVARALSAHFDFERSTHTTSGEVRSFSTLKDVSLNCPNCNIDVPTDLAFHWGIDTDFAEYEMGDAIRWGRYNVGHTIHSLVFVRGVSQDNCPSCSDSQETLIQISNNRIEALETKRLRDKVSAERSKPGAFYIHQTPFITDDLIPLEKVEAIWRQQLVDRKAREYDIADLQLLQQANQASYEHLHWQIAVQKWQYFKLRHLWTDEEYSRITKFLDESFRFKTSDSFTTKQTPVKSCAILRDAELDGERIDAWFAWGDLLNFPEYQLGDQIRWSEYSLGESDIPNVRVVAKLLRSSTDCYEPGRRLDVQIEKNQIKSVSWSPRIDLYGAEFHHKAYVNEKPYLIWPDTDFFTF